MAENILTMENIVKTYKMGDEQQTVLKGIDLQVDKGEFVAILGPSGSGKSTLMNIIGCLDTATSGTYHLHGRDVSALSESELARVRRRKSVSSSSRSSCFSVRTRCKTWSFR